MSCAAAASAKEGDAISTHVEQRLHVWNGLVVAFLTPELHVPVCGTPIAFAEEGITLATARGLSALQATLHEYLLSLREVLLQALGLLAPQVDVVPLGSFLRASRLVVPFLGGREAEFGDGRSARRVAQLGVTAQVADQNHFVDAAHESPQKLNTAFYIVVQPGACPSKRNTPIGARFGMTRTGP